MRIASFIAAMIVVGLVTGCTDPLVRQVRDAATPQQWHAWAAGVLDRYGKMPTNAVGAAEVPASALPGFFRGVRAEYGGWQIYAWPASAGTPAHLFILDRGSFGSAGILVGPPTFSTTNPDDRGKTEQVYPGVYVRRI